MEAAIGAIGDLRVGARRHQHPAPASDETPSEVAPRNQQRKVFVSSPVSPPGPAAAARAAPHLICGMSTGGLRSSGPTGIGLVDSTLGLLPALFRGCSRPCSRRRPSSSASWPRETSPRPAIGPDRPASHRRSGRTCAGHSGTSVMPSAAVMAVGPGARRAVGARRIHGNRNRRSSTANPADQTFDVLPADLRRPASRPC